MKAKFFGAYPGYLETITKEKVYNPSFGFNTPEDCIEAFGEMSDLPNHFVVTIFVE